MKNLDDLLSLRQDAFECLNSAFYEADVDNTGSKAISISGGSLRRKIDVIPANWVNTIDSERTGQTTDRGIMILDKPAKTRIKNKPFHHNRAIQSRDVQFSGNVRKVIRLLKSLRYDADHEIKVSSYDIAALGYNLPDHLLAVPAGYELRLVANSLAFLHGLTLNQELRESLEVPNGTRKIFGGNATSNEELKKLVAELAELKHEIDQGLARSFRKLAEARIEYD